MNKRQRQFVGPTNQLGFQHIEIVLAPTVQSNRWFVYTTTSTLDGLETSDVSNSMAYADAKQFYTKRIASFN